MRIHFNTEQAEILAALGEGNFQGDYAQNFCHLVSNSIQGTSNRDESKTFASSLGLDMSSLKSYIDTCAHAVAEASRLNLSDSDFILSLEMLRSSRDLLSQLKDLYVEQKDSIRDVLSQNDTSVPRYIDLKWRMEAPIASKYHPLGTDIAPHFLFKLETSTPSLSNTSQETDSTLRIIPAEKHNSCFVCDIPNLQHITTELEKAMKELNGVHGRRMQRIFASTDH
ncbi:putative COMM domain containing 2 [Blattamonas nauphoetae]|uniref:COMM domain containing 2 n=1 Tax=Blattamonas nauphoetae TaxID=2049346 RepID=A0ABQ9YLG3_9EUKA|nr:putative COMM domain containing 2 [Blattamonas nauphoetae]